MNWQTIRKGNKTLVVAGMVVAMVLSAASVVTAANQPEGTQNNTRALQPTEAAPVLENSIELQPTEAAPGAAGQFEYNVEIADDGTETLMERMISVGNVNEDVEVWLIDDEGVNVSLGTFNPSEMEEGEEGTTEGGTTGPIESFQNFDSFEISRASDQEVLLKGDLPQNQQ